MASLAVGTNEPDRTSWRPASLITLALAAGPPMALFAWMLLSPGRMVSREMTWDMLFVLAGAWHVFHGQIPHVDFHDPVGALNFLLTAAGYRLVGPSPHAFLVGSCLMALALFAGACVAAARRLPLLPATLFVVLVSLLALMPANAGDLPSAYSFAMSYNRYGWSALSIVALILFLPARDGDEGAGVDQAIVAVLLLALFYLKVTYFAAGLAALGFAIIVCPAVRMRWRSWTAIGVMLAAKRRRTLQPSLSGRPMGRRRGRRRQEQLRAAVQLFPEQRDRARCVYRPGRNRRVAMAARDGAGACAVGRRLPGRHGMAAAVAEQPVQRCAVAGRRRIAAA